jgi:hypothetical protein
VSLTLAVADRGNFVKKEELIFAVSALGKPSTAESAAVNVSETSSTPT